MVTDPYKSGMFKSNPYAQKRTCEGKLAVVLDGKMEGRKLQLIVPPSRAVLAGEIHELIVTDETDAAPGVQVNSIAYWGFFEVLKSTVIVSGDTVWIAGKKLGVIAGFDETHMPNHLNIVIKAADRQTGVEIKLQLEDQIIIKKEED